MATFTKQLLSGSTSGRPIKVIDTATPGTLVHTAHASDDDEVWIYACNTSGSIVELTLEWGGVTSPDDLIVVGIPAQQGLVLIVPGSPLTGGVIVRAFADIADAVNIIGWVNRIT